MSAESVTARLASLRFERAKIKDKRDQLLMSGRHAEAGELANALAATNEGYNTLLRAEHSHRMAGKRIRMVEMIDDPDPIPPGTEGTVTGADDAGHLFVDWDNGRTLHVIPGIDIYNII